MICRTIIFLALAYLTARADSISLRSSIEGAPTRLKLSRTINENAFKQSFLSLNLANATITDAQRSQPLIKAGGMAYHTEITVGEPGQKFLVMIDIGSSELWIPSIRCSDAACLNHRRYDSLRSAKYKKDGRGISMNYGPAIAIGGELSVDQFEFAGLTVSGQTFVEALQIHSTVAVPFDGVLGLGNRPRSQGLVHKTPIENIFEQGAFGQKVFSFKMFRSDGNVLGQSGELIIGGVDHSLYTGDITWSPLTRLSSWEFRIDAIELQHPSGVKSNSTAFLRVCEEGCLAVPDTATGLIVGHPDDILRLNYKIGAQLIADGVFAFEDCHLNLMPNLVITISGRDFVLSPEMYVDRRPEGCISTLRAVGMVPHWVLGAAFLDNFYTVYDIGNKRIGFADRARQS